MKSIFLIIDICCCYHSTKIYISMQICLYFPFCFTVLYNCLLTSNLSVLAIKHKLFSYLVILVMFFIGRFRIRTRTDCFCSDSSSGKQRSPRSKNCRSMFAYFLYIDCHLIRNVKTILSIFPLGCIPKDPNSQSKGRDLSGRNRVYSVRRLCPVYC